MKILHITTSLKGGAGLGLIRLHESLLNIGANSEILCADPITNDEPPRTLHAIFDKDNALAPFPHAQRFSSEAWKHAFFKGCSAAKKIRETYGERFSTAQTRFRIAGEPCVQSADVVHLHWISGFLDIPSFFRQCRKPIVWTMRDEYPLLGGFHYRSSIPKSFPYHLARIDYAQSLMKRSAISAHGNVTFIALSQEMAHLARQSRMCVGCRIFSVPNPISSAAVEAPSLSIAEARRALKLPTDSAVFLFISYNLEEERKGLLRLVDAVSNLHKEGRRAIVVAIGWKTRKLTLPEWVVLPGFIDHPKDFAQWFFAADAFVNPSLSEGCCKTLLDAGAYGTPAVAFPHSGAQEAIGDIGGVVTADFTTYSLIKGLKCVMDESWDRSAIRERALRLFSPDAIAKKHLAIYQSIQKGPPYETQSGI